MTHLPDRAGRICTGVAVLVVVLWGGAVGTGRHDPVASGDAWGLAFGIAAAFVVGVQMLYPARRRLMARPFGTARQALRWHVAGSLLAGVLVLAHQGLRWPGGLFGWLLVAATWSAIGSGLVGLWLQSSLPRRITAHVGQTVRPVRDTLGQLGEQAAQLVRGAAPAHEAWYTRDVAPLFAAPLPRGRAGEAAVIERVLQGAPADASALVAPLRALLDERAQLAARSSIERLLAAWTFVHVPASLALLALLVWHVLAVIYY